MNIEPCVKLGIRISPKISENPADSRNRRPPNVTLLTVSSSQNVIPAALPYPSPVGGREQVVDPSWRRPNGYGSSLEISTWSVADSRANTPDGRGSRLQARSRTG